MQKASCDWPRAIRYGSALQPPAAPGLILVDTLSIGNRAQFGVNAYLNELNPEISQANYPFFKSYRLPLTQKSIDDVLTPFVILQFRISIIVYQLHALRVVDEFEPHQIVEIKMMIISSFALGQFRTSRKDIHHEALLGRFRWLICPEPEARNPFAHLLI